MGNAGLIIISKTLLLSRFLCSFQAENQSKTSLVTDHKIVIKQDRSHRNQKFPMIF